MHPTDRLLAIVLALQEQPWQRAADLADALDVSTRTIYRDMRALEKADVPIVAVPGKGYRLEEDYLLPPLTLTTDEATLLLLACDQLADQLGDDVQPAAGAAREKLTSLLPERLRGERATLQHSLRLGPISAFDEPDEQAALKTLRRALTTQHRVRFGYTERGDTAPSARTVDPYGLLDLTGAWHLVGFDHGTERVRHFRLRQVREIDLLPDTFERPAGYRFTPPKAGGRRDLVVEVLFHPDVAHWVQEAPSFYTVAAEERADGLLVTLKVQRETEVMPWLLSWGRHARVLKPDSLRRRLAREVAAMAETYHPEPTLLP